jgi:hypothetical protein
MIEALHTLGYVTVLPVLGAIAFLKFVVLG